MFKRSRKLVIGLAALGMAWAGFTSDAQAENVELRVATLAPRGSAWMKVLSRGAAEVEKATDGRVKVKYYANGVQGDEKDVVRKLGLGQLDGAALTSVGLSLIDRSIRVLELPRVFASYKELDYVRGRMWGRFQRRFKKKGYMLAPGGGDVGEIRIFTNNNVKSLGDLRRAKMWRWTEDGLVKKMYGKLNVNGVPLGVPQVMAALNTGRINGIYASPIAAVALQWYTKVKYVSDMPLSYGIGGSVVRKAVWDKISSSDQKAIDKILKIQARKLRRVVRRDNKRALKAITRSGVKEVKATPAMIRDVDAAAEAVWKSDAVRKGDFDKVMELRAKFRAK